MSELTITLMRFGLLALLWVFVFSVAGVLRGDIYGIRVVRRRSTVPAQPGLSRSEQRAREKAEKAARKAQSRLATHLVVTDGPLAGTSLPLRDAGTIIGRNPEASLVLDDDYASGRHARIHRDEVGWIAEDLGSTNGTYLDGERLTTPTRVDVGSQLRIGRTVVELRR
ncbi:putative membrane protein [Nostocoides japonicum T1-X7]|uniref:Putative membrane protein n=1 Tax=Nostocoides japonicum T1-X7 TaxID=1194083 RepID=A0A077M3X1_9MICO|nr:FHA domain-containing protein [Tetrasphaera japonica]CCH80521.1 putative membrane protein [Tetrasphaera japonica T1-X7]